MPNIYEITDFNAPELDVYARLTERELYSHFHPKEGLFIAESPNVIHRALDAGYEPVSLLMDRRHVEGQAADIIARCGDVPVYISDLPVLTQLTGFQLTRGVLCAMRRKPLPTAEEVCRDATRIVVLENVMNPTNVGAIFRSAAALHIDAPDFGDGSRAIIPQRNVNAQRVNDTLRGQLEPERQQEAAQKRLQQSHGYATC